MNKVILMGRLTRDPGIQYSQDSTTAVARYTLAVDRRYKKEGDQQTADFISCVCFGKNAEFAEKYLHQGTKIVVCGRIQTGSFINRQGQKVYTTDVVVEEHDFAESKASAAGNQGSQNSQNTQQGNASGSSMPTDPDGFMQIPDDVDEELPFN